MSPYSTNVTVDRSHQWVQEMKEPCYTSPDLPRMGYSSPARIGEVVRHDRYTQWGSLMPSLATDTNVLDIDERKNAKGKTDKDYLTDGKYY